MADRRSRDGGPDSRVGVLFRQRDSRDQVRSFSTGRARERIVATLLGAPDRLLTAVLFWNLVINLLYFAISVVICRRLATAGFAAAAGATGVSALLGILLVGEVLPKSIAVVFRVQLAPLVSWPLATAVRVLDPVVPLLGRVAGLLRRAFWPQLRRERHLRAEDLERAVDASRGDDALILQERQVLHNILDLSDISVEEVMRPRGMFSSIRSPVSINALKGVDAASDYVMLQGDRDELPSAIPLSGASQFSDEGLEQTAEDVVYVPWCAQLSTALQLMRERFSNVAVVVNEFGETAGIVTYEDIVDTILRPTPSRTKRMLRREPVLEIAPGRYHVEGLTTLRYLGKRLGIDFDPGPDNLVTVAGMLQEQLEHLPEVGDECLWQGVQFRVFDVPRRGQLRVVVSRAS